MLILHRERLLAAAGLEMEYIINFMQTDGHKFVKEYEKHRCLGLSEDYVKCMLSV